MAQVSECVTLAVDSSHPGKTVAWTTLLRITLPSFVHRIPTPGGRYPSALNNPRGSRWYAQIGRVMPSLLRGQHRFEAAGKSSCNICTEDLGNSV